MKKRKSFTVKWRKVLAAAQEAMVNGIVGLIVVQGRLERRPSVGIFSISFEKGVKSIFLWGNGYNRFPIKRIDYMTKNKI